MYRIVRKPALFLAALAASLLMSPLVRADIVPQQQYQQQQTQRCEPPPPPMPPGQYQLQTNQAATETPYSYKQPAQQQQYQQPSYNSSSQNAVADDKLTDEQLGVMLRGFGLEPTTSRNDAGGTTYTTKIERDGWTFTVNFALSSDHTNLWLSQSLTKLPNPQNVPTSALLKLMEWNNTNTAVFSFDSQNGSHFVISQPVANHGISAGKMRTTLDNFLGSIRKSESLWSEKTLAAFNTSTAFGN